MMIEIDNKKPYVIAIIVLSIIIVALAGFIALDKLVINKKEETNLTTIGEVNIDLNAMYKIGDIMNRLDHTFNDMNSNYFGYIYTDKKIEAKKFDKAAALFLAIYDNLIPSNTQQQLYGSEVKKNFEAIFGKELQYEANNIDAGNTYKIFYDGTSGIYSYTLPLKNSLLNPGYVTETIKTKLESGRVIVTRKVFYVEYEDNNSLAKIYSTAGKNKLLGSIRLKNNLLNTKEILAKYSSKMNSYQYIFIENSDSNYTLSSIEKIK